MLELGIDFKNGSMLLNDETQITSWWIRLTADKNRPERRLTFNPLGKEE